MDTKKLRQKILDLAIHGKLVPQDPNDEPASVLLERIREEKERLVKEGKIKKSKKSATSDTSHYENVPFEVPEGWCWCSVGDIVYDLKYGTSKKSSESGSVPVLRMGNLTRKGTISYDNLVYSSDSSDIEEYELTTGDLLFNRTNSSEWVGKTALYDGKVKSIYAGYLIRVRTIIINSEYLNIVMNSQYYRNWCYSVKTDAVNQSNINANKLASLLVPIPPISEQNQIVQEVTKMTEFIDLIEQGESDLQSIIGNIKSKILELAIHGKLVPQDANDEPASELLKRINPKAFASCDNPHYAEPYELPHGWTWIELGKLAVDSADGPFGSNLKKEHYTMSKEVRIIQLSNIGEDGWRDENTKYTTFEHLSEISRSEVHSDDIVIAKMMPAGRAIICPSSDVKYVLSSDAVKFVLPEGICNEYILNSINSSVFREQVYDNVQGVTRVRTSLQKLRTYLLPLPPYNEQLRIVQKVKELFTQLDMIEKSLQA